MMKETRKPSSISKVSVLIQEKRQLAYSGLGKLNDRSRTRHNWEPGDVMPFTRLPGLIMIG